MNELQKYDEVVVSLKKQRSQVYLLLSILVKLGLKLGTYSCFSSIMNTVLFFSMRKHFGIENFPNPPKKEAIQCCSSFGIS